MQVARPGRQYSNWTYRGKTAYQALKKCRHDRYRIYGGQTVNASLTGQASRIDMGTTEDRREMQP